MQHEEGEGGKPAFLSNYTYQKQRGINFYVKIAREIIEQVKKEIKYICSSRFYSNYIQYS